ncbi:Fatty acyl-CoA reductase 3 [Acorus calamus]|uniref:Fatty acyl-CoA reductase 3 n=1 Tax=Acorus calamus TaxID=4465 RepID=A0AAV9EAM1_ACOCL|nr:Fatty acyl-CoA reductase 3 [Acorus calamus]
MEANQGSKRYDIQNHGRIQDLHEITLWNISMGLRMINYDSNIFERRYKYILALAELYEPFTFFKGRFDDTNLRDLLTMAKSNIDKKFFVTFNRWIGLITSSIFTSLEL